MKKESLADKLARKSFESASFQQSWQVHLQAFGPILEPAFEDDYQAKVHLCAALNHISKRQLSQAIGKLKSLQKFVQTDADKCAYLFFMGLYCEMAGNQEQMLSLYTMANEYGHKLYLPYLKVGKFYLNGHHYEKAEENYRAAIGCYTARGLSQQDKIILGSAHANLASCLMMTRRLEESEAALATSRSLCPDAPGRAAVEATLYALQEKTEQMEAALDSLKAHSPAVWESVKETTEKILAKADPIFFPQPIEEGAIKRFWDWFRDYSSELKEKLDKEQYEEGLTLVAECLLDAFPFLEETPNVALGKNEQGWVLQFQDLYAVAVMDAYEKLLAACPEEVNAAWQFDVVHV